MFRSLQQMLMKNGIMPPAGRHPQLQDKLHRLGLWTEAMYSTCEGLFTITRESSKYWQCHCFCKGRCSVLSR